jgi:hypothetical protein
MILKGLSFLLVLVAAGIMYSNQYSPYTVVVINSDFGWGYNILYNHKLIIHQPNIPSVSGQVSFRDKKSARRTGNLVARKLKNHQSPGITRNDLESIIKPLK